MKSSSIMPRSAANVTAEVLAAWKKDYPTGVFELVVNSGEFETITEEGKPPVKKPVPLYKGYMRKPTRDEMREFTSKQTDPVTYTEIVLDALWLGGDEQIKIDDEAFYSVMPQVQNVLDIKGSEIKKL
ncbi:hypothetical protein [Mucilaginibacter kameinonensis]|uniref:hypothetical protein n=1 Tax=Mucilaginibacter kameinonensis TaxID=452286 RepID=UPI0013CF1A01|nr:hypothetical protein [Mucilaginibacter kameinonensis]